MDKIINFCHSDKNCFVISKKVIQNFRDKNITIGWGNNENDLVHNIIQSVLNKNKWNSLKEKKEEFIFYVNKIVINEATQSIYNSYKEFVKEREKIMSIEKSNGKGKGEGVENDFEKLKKNRFNEMNPEQPETPNFSDNIKTNDKINLDSELEMIKQRRKINDDELISSMNTSEMNMNMNEVNIHELTADVDITKPDVTTIATTTLLSDTIDSLSNNVAKEPKELQILVEDLKNKHKFTESRVISIDSRDRNTDSYPDPNMYQIDFGDTLKNVFSIELLSAIVPKSDYNINSNNNTIYFSENGGSEITASIPEGNYTITELLTAIGSAMTSSSGLSWTYTATYDSKTNKITITTGNVIRIFELYFIGGTEKYGESSTRSTYKLYSIGSTIGFTRTDLTGSYTYTGTNQYNLTGENYLMLKMENFGTMIGTETSNKSISGAFTKINLNVSQNEFKYYNNGQEYISKLEFGSPIGKLSQMNIRFYNYDGSLYNFNGMEHSLFFRIKSLKADWANY